MLQPPAIGPWRRPRAVSKAPVRQFIPQARNWLPVSGPAAELVYGAGLYLVYCLDAAFPGLKEFQKVLASRFEARCDAQKGITSKEFDFGD